MGTYFVMDLVNECTSLECLLYFISEYRKLFDKYVRFGRKAKKIFCGMFVFTMARRQLGHGQGATHPGSDWLTDSSSKWTDMNKHVCNGLQL